MMLLTSGQIARQIHEDRDRVAYALRKTGVEPIGRAGLVRLFGPDALEKVRQFLDTKTNRRQEIPKCIA
jgi:hypothetical protein